MEEKLRLGRYKEKQTDKYWDCCGWFHKDDVRYYYMRLFGDRSQERQLTKEDIEAKFDYAPIPSPIFKTEGVVPRHPILITLICPECGHPLQVKGGAILTSPLQYEHECSNKDCSYHKCTLSIFSGMYALVTDEQEKCINDGTYSERNCGKIFQISEIDAALFRNSKK